MIESIESEIEITVIKNSLLLSNRLRVIFRVIKIGFGAEMI